jgi:predicted peptidase
MAIGNQTRHHLRCHFEHANGVEYLLHRPAGYEAAMKKRWPLMLFLHGAGERGASVNKVAAHGPPKLVQTQPEFPFILVSPLCPTARTWSREILLTLLDEIILEHRVNRRRVYLTGLSMGGYAAWDLAVRHPERFAAVAPICGGGDVLPVLLAEGRTLQALRHLPVWAFHGADDPLVPVGESERMIAALRKIGNDAKLTIYPDCEHDSWTRTYSNPELYNWFLEHTRRA